VTTWGAAAGAGTGTSGLNVSGLRRFAKREAGTRRLGGQPPGTGSPGTGPPGTGPPGTGPLTPPQAIAPAAGDHQELNGLAGLVAGLPALDSIPGLAGERRQDDAAVEHCELCREVLTDRHGHLVDTDKRSLACACRACYLLFTQEGAGGGRYRAVPERIYHDPSRPLSDLDWNDLQIPVAMAFFFYNSAIGRVVAGYPSPAGPTECELDLEAWDRIAAGHPLLGEMAPDVEAILVNRTDLGNEVFLIPIDMCYSLVGELRMYWTGFDGGAEVRTALATFMTGLRHRAVALERRTAGQELGH
jgi:hypothetical protein